jgi:hypothetical protein
MLEPAQGQSRHQRDLRGGFENRFGGDPSDEALTAVWLEE